MAAPRTRTDHSHKCEPYSGGNAVISLIFAEYLNRLFWHETFAGASVDDLPQWSIKLTAVAAVVIVSVICVASPNLGTRTAVVFTTVKVGDRLFRARTDADVPLGPDYSSCKFKLCPKSSACVHCDMTAFHYYHRASAISSREGFHFPDRIIIRQFQHKSVRLCSRFVLWSVGL